MRSIGVVTVGRSDYGIYQPLLRRLSRDRGVRLGLFVGGMHLEPRFGMTVRMVEEDGYPIVARVRLDMRSDSPVGVARAMGSGVAGFARAYSRWRPDILVVLGDRYEMHAAALAALPARIPVAHIHGGELTLGAIDDCLRHSITKLSHLHFVSTRKYARRVMQMGEEPWRVKVVGALGLDNLRKTKLLKASELEAEFGIRLTPRPLLVTFHPVTLEYDRTAWQVGELMAALHEAGRPVVFTLPNADTGNRIVRQQIEKYVGTHRDAWLVENFGVRGYFSMMSHAAAMVGNSSSGIIEAASFGLPVVNIGSRQDGRVRPGNVVDVGHGRRAIGEALRRTVGSDRAGRLTRFKNPYDLGVAARIIGGALCDVPLRERLAVKRFADQGRCKRSAGTARNGGL